MANLSIDGETSSEILFVADKDFGGTQSYDMCLVGRFISYQTVNFIAMKQTLPSLWRPAKGMIVKQSENDNLYVFQFFHAVDLIRVMEIYP